MEEAAKGFVILNGDNIVVNIVGYLTESDVQPDMTLEQFLLSDYDNTYKYIEFSTNNSITNNQPGINCKYNESMNAFIQPRQNDTYILNEETFEWEPDPNLEYDLYGDGIKYKYSHESGWSKVNN